MNGEERIIKKLEEFDVQFKNIDANFGKVDVRLGKVEDCLDKMGGRLDKMDERFDGIGGRLDKMDERFDMMDVRLDTMDARFDGMDGRLGSVERTQARIIGELVDMKIYLREKVATKDELQTVKSEIMTHIDGFAVRQEKFDHELAAVRARMDRLESGRRA